MVFHTLYCFLFSAVPYQSNYILWYTPVVMYLCFVFVTICSRNSPRASQVWRLNPFQLYTSNINWYNLYCQLHYAPCPVYVLHPSYISSSSSTSLCLFKIAALVRHADLPMCTCDVCVCACIPPQGLPLLPKIKEAHQMMFNCKDKWKIKSWKHTLTINYLDNYDSRKEKYSMTRLRRPQTCSHPIYTRTLTGVHRAVRNFLLAIFLWFNKEISATYSSAQ